MKLRDNTCLTYDDFINYFISFIDEGIQDKQFILNHLQMEAHIRKCPKCKQIAKDLHVKLWEVDSAKAFWDEFETYWEENVDVPVQQEELICKVNLSSGLITKSFIENLSKAMENMKGLLSVGMYTPSFAVRGDSDESIESANIQIAYENDENEGVLKIMIGEELDGSFVVEASDGKEYEPSLLDEDDGIIEFTGIPNGEITIKYRK